MREQVCGSCGGTYSATRASSRYCSEVCKKRAQRTAGELDGRKALIVKALQAASFMVGRVSHLTDTRGLMLPRAAAVTELNGFLALAEPVTDAELQAALRAEGIMDYSADLPASQRGLRKLKRAA